MSHSNDRLRTPLKLARGLGSAKSGTGHFLWQRITAIALALLGALLALVVVRRYREAYE